MSPRKRRADFRPLVSTPTTIRKEIEAMEELLRPDHDSPILRKSGGRKLETLVRLLGGLAKDFAERVYTFEPILKSHLDSAERAAIDGYRVKGTIESLHSLADLAADYSSDNATEAIRLLLVNRLGAILFDLHILMERGYQTLDGVGLLNPLIDLAIVARWVVDMIDKWERSGD